VERLAALTVLLAKILTYVLSERKQYDLSPLTSSS
jgi:hypothetical protein